MSVCHDVSVEVRQQPSEVSSLLPPCGSQNLAASTFTRGAISLTLRSVHDSSYVYASILGIFHNGFLDLDYQGHMD